MKKFTFLMAMVLGFALNALAINPYAYAVSASVESGNVSVAYSLNADASAVALQFCQNDVVAASVALTGVTAGAHSESVAVPATLNGTYTLKVAATGATHDFDVTAIPGVSYAGRIHACVDPYPTSPNFGNIYVSSRDGSNRGAYVIAPNYVYKNTTVQRFGYENAMWGSMQRGAVAPNGEMWFSSWSDGNSGIHRFNPAVNDTVVTQFFLGTRASSGLFTNEGAETGCSTPGIGIYAAGADSKLYMVAEDFTGGSTQGSLAIYNIGQADGSIVTSWGVAPSAHFNTITDKANTNFAVCATPYGAWLTQHRAAGSNSSGARSLQFITVNGVQKYISTDTDLINGSNGAGIVTNATYDKLWMVNGDGNILQMSVVWGADTVPTLTKDTIYTTAYAAFSQLSFDFAGNIVAAAHGNYASGATDATVAIISLPAAEAPVAATPVAGEFEFSAAPQLNVYAYDIVGAMAEGTLTVSYKLNAAATSVELVVLNGTTELTYPLAGTAKGLNTASVAIDLPDGTYPWAIRAAGNAVEELTEITTDDDKYRFYLPQDLAIDNNPNSPYFGHIYVSESTIGQNDGGSTVTKTQTRGIYIYTPDLLLADGQAAPLLGYDGGLGGTNTTRAGFKRLAIDEEGYVYVASRDAATQGIYRMNPATPSAPFATVLSATAAVDALTIVGNTLYTLEGVGVGLGNYNAYTLAATLGAPVSTVAQDGLIGFASSDCSIAFDNAQGGLWFCEHRWAVDAYPCLVHLNAHDVRDYAISNTENTSLLGNTVGGASYRGVVAVNKDGSLLAMGSEKRVVVFGVAYDAAGVPTLTRLYTTPQFGTNCDGVAFDVADNLYVASASAERLYVFATPKAANVTTVPAADRFALQFGQPSYTITFKDYHWTGSKAADSGTTLTVNDTLENVFATGVEYVAAIKNVAKVYPARDRISETDLTSCGVKFGSSSAAGMLELKLATPVMVDSVVLSAAMYGDSEGGTGFSVNGTPFTLSAGNKVFEHVVYTTTEALRTIKIEQTQANKGRFYLNGITVYYNNQEVPAIPQYYLAGSMNGWSANGTAFEDGELDINLAAGNYEFKVTKGDWSWERNASHVNHECSSANVRGNGNIHVSLAEAGNMHIEVLGDTALCITGNFAAKDVVNEWTVVGDPVILGSNWDLNDANNTMVADGNLFKLTKTGLALTAKGYQWKVVGDHTWATQYPASGDYYLNIDHDGTYDVTFVLDFANDTAWSTFEEVVAETPMLNNPIGADGKFIVKYDCAAGAFAAANDMEVGETFVFAVDITGTWLADWVAAPATTAGAQRGIAINKWTSRGDLNGDAVRFKQISGNIWGMLVNFSQQAQGWADAALMTDSTTTVYGQIFGFEYTEASAGAAWWQWDGHDVVTTQAPGVDGLFTFAPSTGKVDADFMTEDYVDGMYGYNVKGYAAPCSELKPAESALENFTGSDNAVKFVKDGKVYIRRNGHIYTAAGAMVE